MDGAPGLVTGLAAAGASVVTAWITRGSGAGITELREQLKKVDARLAIIETDHATLKSLPADFAALSTRLTSHLNTELQAAVQKYTSLRRHTGSQPSLPSPDELGRMMGFDELRRQVADLREHVDEVDAQRDRARDEARMEGIVLQRELSKITTTLEFIVGGKLK